MKTATSLLTRSWAFAVLFTAAVALPVGSQQATHTIRYEFKAGNAYAFNMTDVVTSRQEILRERRPATQSQNTRREVWRVLDVHPDQTASVEVATDNSVTVADGATKNDAAELRDARLTPEGIFVDVRTADSAIGTLPILPPRAVRVGETWTREQRTEFASGALATPIAIKGTYTLVSVDSVDNDSRARIDGTLEGTVGSGRPVRVEGFDYRISGRVTGKEQMIWSLGAQRPMTANSDNTLEMRIEVRVGSESAQGQFNLRIQNRLEGVTPPTPILPAADAIIVPGQSVAGIGFNASVEDVSRRFGQPREEDRIYSLRSIPTSWPAGLRAYPNLQTGEGFTAIEIFDPKFRTERGLGVGSTRGEVAAIHGTRPEHRVEVLNPARNWKVNLVVYDSLGVAYAISTSGGSEPVGRVEWVLIFPPGRASSVVSLR